MDEKIGVIFLGTPRMTPKGNKYYVGKTEGSEEFDLTAWVNVSRSGNEYLTIKKKEIVKKEEQEPSVAGIIQAQTALDNETVEPSDLPF